MHFALLRLRVPLAVVAAFLLAVVVSAQDVTTAFDERCPLNDLVPCGLGLSPEEKSGAFYRFQGVESEVPFQEILSTDREAGTRLQAVLGNEAAQSQTYNRLLFDITFLSGVTTGCRIDEEWNMSKRFLVGQRPQCALKGPCSVPDNCFELQGPVAQPFIIDTTIGNVFYAQSTSHNEGTVPFDMLSFRRKQRGRMPNSDQEDNQATYMRSKDDDRYVSGGNDYSTDGYDDDDEGMPTRCDDDNMNSCDDSDGDILQPCFRGDDQPRFLLSAYGHPYYVGSTGDKTCGKPNDKDPGIDDKCTDNCVRSLNPEFAEFVNPFVVDELYEAYHAVDAVYQGCDLLQAGFDGCQFGGSPADWGYRITGDDDDDTGGSQAADDDDDDDLDNDDSCLVERGDGTKQTIHGDAFMSMLALRQQGADALERSVYAAIATTDDGSTTRLLKPVRGDSSYMVAPTCSFCQADSDNSGRGRARRFFQYEVKPTCDLFQYDTTDTPSIVWSGEATVAGETFDFATEYPDGAMTSTRSVAAEDTGSPVFGSVISVTLGDASIYQAPTDLITTRWPATVECFDESNPRPLQFSAANPFPFNRGPTNSCNGCTPLQEAGFGDDQRHWFFMPDVGFYYSSCQRSGLAVGWADGGVQTTSFHSSMEMFDTNEMSQQSFGLCADAVEAEAAPFCRPVEAVLDDGTISVSPAAMAASYMQWYNRVLDGEFTDNSPSEINQLFATDSGLAAHGVPVSYKPAITPNIWLLTGETGTSQSRHSLCTLAGLVVDDEGGLLFEDDGAEAVHFRLAFYIPNSAITLGNDALVVTDFTTSSVGSSSLCPITYAEPVPSACQNNAPYANTAAAVPFCGYTLLRASFEESVSYAADDTRYTIRFNYEDCNANFIFPLCTEADQSACNLFLGSQIQFTLGDETATALQQGASVLFYASVNDNLCDASCPIKIQQRLGGGWRTIAEKEVPSCRDLSVPADGQACFSVGATATPTPAATPSASGSVTPSQTPSIGSSISSTPSATTTPSLTSTLSTTPSRSAVAGQSASAQQQLLPSVSSGASASPSITPSASASGVADPGSGDTPCDTCDLACKCSGTYADAGECFFDPCGAATILVCFLAIVCCLTCCFGGCFVAYKYRKKRSADKHSGEPL